MPDKSGLVSSVITLSHTSGPAGVQVALTGANFDPQVEVPIWWENPIDGSTQWLGSAGTREDGSFRMDIGIPENVVPGQYVIKAVIGDSTVANTTYTVTAHTIHLNVATGERGTSVLVNGEGLLPGSEVTVKWDSIFAWPVATGVVEPNGSFSLSFPVPADAITGASTIYVQSGWLTVEAPFQVTDTRITASVSISTASGMPGAKVSVTGEHFIPGQRVNIRWGSTAGPVIGYKDATDTGTFSGAFLVPKDALAGSTQVFLEDGTSFVSASFTVLAPATPTVSLSPVSARPGNRVTVTGTNFRPGERVSIRWGSAGGPILGYKDVGLSGTVSGAIVVPPTAAAGTTQIYLQAPSATVSARFTVIVALTPTGTVSPISALPGARVTVTGANFTPGERVNIRWGTSTGPVLGYKNADSTGKVSGAIVVPASAPAGTTRIYLQADSGSASAPFTVTARPSATVTLSPTSALPGAKVTISGANFKPGERVNIRWDSSTGSILGYKNADSTGKISGVIAVPTTASAGTTRIYLQASSGSASAQFTVKARPSATLALSPTSALPGAKVTITGANFKSGERVNIRWGSATGPILGYTTAGTTGAVSGVVVVPATASAGTTRVYLQAPSATASAAFTVQARPKANISLAYDYATHGDVVGIQGWNFLPGEVVAISFPGGVVVTRVTVQSNGSFSGRFTVPTSARVGNNTITVRGTTSGYTAGILLQVYKDVPVSVSPRALPGAVIVFSGTGFMPGEVVFVYWDEVELGTVTANSSGGVADTILISTGASLGDHYVILIASGGLRAGAATVEVVPWSTPYIRITASAPPGGPVYFEGSGFGPNEYVVIRDWYTDELVGSTISQPDGTYTGIGNAPRRYYGPTYLYAEGQSSGRWVRVYFTVTVAMDSSRNRVWVSYDLGDEPRIA